MLEIQLKKSDSISSHELLIMKARAERVRKRVMLNLVYDYRSKIDVGKLLNE